jgi:hypothetical protein
MPPSGRHRKSAHWCGVSNLSFAIKSIGIRHEGFKDRGLAAEALDGL